MRTAAAEEPAAPASAPGESLPEEESLPVAVLGEQTEKRTLNSKTVHLSNGAFRAAVYPVNVHYEAPGGTLEDYNNTLEKTAGAAGEYYAPKASDLTLRIAAQTGPEAPDTVSVAGDGWALSWRYAEAAAQTAEINNPAPDGDPVTPDHLTSEALFPEVFSNASLQYVLYGGVLKENILLSSANAPAVYTAVFTCEGLTPRLSDNGKCMELLDGQGEPVCRLEAPYAADAAGAACTDLFYELSAVTAEGFTAALQIGEEWLRDASRVFPVAVDPILLTKQQFTGTGNQSAYVASATPTATYGQGGQQYEGSVYAGYATGKGVMRGYIKFGLPALGAADCIVNANMFLYLHQSDSLSLTVHEVTGSWAQSTVNWNNKPGYSSEVVDHKTIIPQGQYENYFIDFDVTKPVSAWYAGAQNYGLMIKSTNENISYWNCAWFFSTGYTGNSLGRPLLEIEYRNTSGYEDYYAYLGFAAGRGGSADVNVYNGNLVSTQPLTVETGGEALPVQLNAVYNANKGAAELGRIGNGWKLNYQMFIRPNPHLDSTSAEDEQKYKYYFEDGDGTQHYFYFSDLNGTAGTDEDGMGCTLDVNTSVSETSRTSVRYTVTDKNGGKMEFNGYGNLLCVRDTNGNEISLAYDGVDPAEGHYERLKTVTDGLGRTYTLTYYAAWPTYISYVTDPAGRKTNFSTSSSLLQSITYADNKAVTFSYDSVSPVCLTSVTDLNGVQTRVSYTGGAIKRVSELKTAVGTAVAERYAFSYQPNETTVTDISSLTYTYQFDSYGHPTGVTANESGEASAATYVEGYQTSPTANRLTSSSRVQKSVDNYAQNPGFHTGISGYSLYKSVSTDASSWNYDSSYGRSAAGSMHVAHPASSAGYVLALQAVYVPAGTYTVSAYVSTKNAVIPVNAPFLSVEVRTASAHIASYNAERIGGTGTGNWKRQAVTLTLTSGQYLRIQLGFVQGASGEAWFDDVQVEAGYGESSYNLLENPQFRTGVNGVWTASDSSITLPGANTGSAAMQFAVIPGNITGQRSVSQTVKYSGAAGQVFSFGAWAQADSVSLENKKLSTNTRWALFWLRFELLDGGDTVTEATAEYNPHVGGLQFVSGRAVATDDFTHVRISFEYDYNANTALFSGAYVLAEEYGQTYTYDGNGNLVSAADTAQVENAYGYAGSDLTSVQSDSRARAFAGYDSVTKNVHTALNTANRLYTYEYDSYGGLTQARLQTAGFTTQPEAGKTYYIVNADTGMALAAGSGTAPVNAVNKMAQAENAGVQWLLEAGPAAGEYYLKLCSNAKYLKVSSAGSGTKELKVAAKNAPDDALYVFKPVASADGALKLLTKTSNYGYAVDARWNHNETAEEGHVVYQYVSSQKKASQRWYFFEVISDAPYMQATSTYVNGYPRTVTDVNGVALTYYYNSSTGNLSSVKDSDNYSTSYSYDVLSRPTEVTRYGMGAEYTYTNDLLTSIVASGGTSYTLTHDAFGRLTKTQANGITLAQTHYDAYGRVSYRTDAAGCRTDYTYDSLDRLSLAEYTGGESVSYYYGADGRIAHTADTGSNTHTRYVYDLAGRMVQAREYTGTAVTGNTLQSALEYTYADGTNQVSAITAVSALGENTLGVTYGDLSLAQSADYVYAEQWNGNTARTYTYDAFGRLQSSTTAASVPLQSVYTYRNISTARTTAQVSSLQTAAGTFSYTYDSRGNLTSVSDGTYTTRYEYDIHGMLTREDNQRAGETYVYRYQYDNAGDTCGGNILSRKVYSYTTGTPVTLLRTDTYTYGSSAWGDLLTAYNGSGIVYDDAMPCIYRGKTVDWDRAGLISELMDTQTVQYAYSAAGKRLQKDVAGTVTDFIYAGDLLLGWQCGSNELAFLFSSNGDAYGFTYNGTPYYYVKNLQNDVIAIASAAGTIVARYYYDAWGRLLDYTDSTSVQISQINPIRYRSYYYDTESGFYFLNSRYYDPETGRFISPDIGLDLFNLIGLNIFVYCNNNPINMVDKAGNRPKWVVNALDFLSDNIFQPIIDFFTPKQTYSLVVTETVRLSFHEANRRPNTGEPNSTFDAPNGDYRKYGPDGNPLQDYDHDDHGHPESHPHDVNGGHYHDWVNGKRGKPYVSSWEPVLGFSLVCVCVIGFAIVILDDTTGVGVVDDVLYGPLAAGIAKGLFMAFG